MFSTYALTSNILRGTHQYSKLTIRNLVAIRNSITSTNRNVLFKLQPKTNINSSLHRFYTNGPKTEPVKSKKIVGYWLLGCSGAVVLGGVFVYIALLLSICTILEKYLVHTTK